MFDQAMRAEISRHVEALRGLCGSLELDDATVADAGWACDLGESLSRLGCSVTARFAARSASDEAWRAEHRSAVEWFAAVHGTTKAQADRDLKLSARLPKLPLIAAALHEGSLSAAAAAPIAEAAAVVPAAEAELVELARTGTLGELRSACERVKASADRDREATRKRRRQTRSYRCWFSDGEGHLHLRGPAEELVRVHNKVLDQAGRRFRATRHRAPGDREPIEAHRYDAAVEAILGGGDGKPVPAGADAKIIVRVDRDALLRGHPLDGELCEIAGIGPVPVSVVREWFDDAFIAAVLTHGTDVTRVVHLGRRFTAHQVTALQFRDPECLAKGCANTVALQLDHDTGWAVTHSTEVNDAQRFCPACHRKKTLGWWPRPPDQDGKRELLPPHHPDHPDQSLKHALADAGFLPARHRGAA